MPTPPPAPCLSSPRDPAGRRVLVAADFVQLEGIRGLAALYVVANHARALLSSNHGLYSGPIATLPLWKRPGAYLNLATLLGHEAVIVFFVLSGFSIAHSLRTGPGGAGFLLRRFVRLYPPYLLSLLYAAAVVALAHALAPAWIDGPAALPYFASIGTAVARYTDLGADLRALVYLGRNTITPQNWSLVHEWYFYLSIPVLIRRPDLFLVAALAFLAAGQGLELSYGGVGSPGEYLFHYAAFFALGVSLFGHYSRIAAGLTRVGKPVLVGIAVTLCAGMLALRLGHDSTLATELLAALLAIVLIVLVLELHLPLLPAIGHVSYTLYLTHYASLVLTALVLGLLLGWTLPIESPYVWWIGLPSSLLIAHGLHLVAERPSQRWLRRSRAR